MAADVYPAQRESTWDREAVSGLLFVLPVAGLFIALRVVPALWALYLSFTEYSVIQPPKMVGLNNYVTLLRDDLFRTAFVNTLYYTLGTTIPSTLLALGIALMLDQKVRGLAIFRTAFYIPVVASMVSVSTIWIYIFNPQFGVLNYFVSSLGLPRQGWLDDPYLAMPSVIVVGIWKNLGYNVVVYLAGLQGIPPYLHEAAMVDGATGLRRFLRITWPLLLPTTVFILLMTGIVAFQAFDQILVLTAGGPANATTTVVHEIYRTAFQFLKMGYASAMAFVLFATILVMSLLTLRLGRREIRY